MLHNQVIEFALRQITTDQFAILQENYSPDKEIILFNDFHFSMNAQIKMVKAQISLRFQQEEKTVMLLEVSCIFKIKDDSWQAMQDKAAGTITIPNHAAQSFAAILLGTARGILHDKTAGTVYNGYIVPLQDLTTLIIGDFQFKLGGEEASNPGKEHP